MSGLVDKIMDKVSQKADKNAQPGNQVEGQADTFANNEVNQVAGDAGVPQQDNQTIDTLVDDKVNSDIPFGNK